MAEPIPPSERERKLLSREQNYEMRDWCRSLDRSEHQVRQSFFAAPADATPPARAALDFKG